MWEQLIEAIKKDNTSEAIRLINQIDPLELNKANEFGMALHIAAAIGLKEICKLLISKMTTEAINAVNQNKYTAFHLAARTGLNEICEMLTNSDQPETSGNTDLVGDIAPSADSPL